MEKSFAWMEKITHTVCICEINLIVFIRNYTLAGCYHLQDLEFVGDNIHEGGCFKFILQK